MLDSFEQLLRKQITESDIPFLGLHGAMFTDEMHRSIKRAVKDEPTFEAYLDNLTRWPALFSIYLTMFVMRGFGETGHFKVYSYIEEALGEVTLKSSKRKEELWAVFRFACRQLGLEVSIRRSGSNYMVDEYLRQAGVPLTYVPALTERMLRLGSQAGIPEDDDPDGIRLWQDELLTRLGLPFSQTAHKALELDQGGYYVRLFLRLLSGGCYLDTIKSDVESRMLETIQANGQGIRRASKTVAIPRIVLHDYQIGVQLPGVEDRGWIIDVDGIRKTFQAKQETRFILIDNPLPQNILIEDTAGSVPRNYTIWPGVENNLFLVFSKTTGAFKGSFHLGNEFGLEPGDYHFLLRFCPDDFPGTVECVVEDPHLYGIMLSLKPGERYELRRGPAVAVIQVDEQPLINWVGTSINSNEGHEVFASENLNLEIFLPDEFVNNQQSDYVLRILPGDLGTSCEYPLTMDKSGHDTVNFEVLAKKHYWKPGLGRVLLELRRKGENRAIIRSSAFVWNDLNHVKRRVKFQCSTLPTNLDLRLSSNVKIFQDSRIVTYHDENQRFFIMVFKLIEGRFVSLTWNLPGIFLYIEEHLEDGTLVERAIRKGSSLVVGSLSRQQLRIYSNEQGYIRLGSLNRLVNFTKGGSIRLPLSGLAEYLTPGSTTLEFIPDNESSIGIPLVSLIHPHEALKFEVKQNPDLISLELQLCQEVQNFRLLAQDIFSGQMVEADLVPTDTEQTGSDPENLRFFHYPIKDGLHSFSINLSTEKWPKGAWIINVEAKINHNLGPLYNARQDHYAVGFLLCGPHEQAHVQFLAEDLKMADFESLVSSRLDSSDGGSSDIRDEIINWLNSGKRVTIHLTNELQRGRNALQSTRLTATYRHLNPFAYDGRLVISQLSGLSEQDLVYCPRIFTEPMEGTPLWFTEYPNPPLLEVLLPEPIYEGKVNEQWMKKLTTVLRHSHALSRDCLREGQPIEFWEISSGMLRELDIFFSPVKGNYIDRLVIRDPYCGVGEKNRNALYRFVREIMVLASSIKYVEIHCREAHSKQPNYEPAYEMENRIREQFRDLPFNLSLVVQSNRTSSRKFHDREIAIHIVNKDGCTVEHRYHLSGGIDYLMDINSESKLFHYRLDD